MKLKHKLAVLGVSGVTLSSLVIGGATYALFTSQAHNDGNAFTAGTLKISSYRDDVPNQGPMFYTDTTNLPGTLATGVWAPGDRVTRGLFLENKGSLDARLKTISADFADPSGNIVSSGSYYNDDLKFSNNSRVIVWQVQWFDPLGNLIPWLKLDSTTMDLLMQYVNQGYASWASAHPGADPSTDPSLVDQVIEFVNQYLLDHINSIHAAGTVNDGTVKVTKMFGEELHDVATNAVDVSNMNIQTAPGQAQLLAFTVQFSRGANNTLQGLSSYFNFDTSWEQVRNNP